MQRYIELCDILALRRPADRDDPDPGIATPFGARCAPPWSTGPPLLGIIENL